MKQDHSPHPQSHIPSFLDVFCTGCHGLSELMRRRGTSFFKTIRCLVLFLSFFFVENRREAPKMVFFSENKGKTNEKKNFFVENEFFLRFFLLKKPARSAGVLFF